MKPSNQTINNKPPSNALRVARWSDLPKDRTPAQYKIIAEDGRVRLITLSKGKRIVLDALLKQPVYCASPVRVSDCVCTLLREYHVPIIKEMYENDAATDRAKFGVYFLNGRVERVSGDGGAA